jgi:tetratricopeptide (TPR) repeat protein
MCLRELKQFENGAECFKKLFQLNPSRTSAEFYAAILAKCVESKDAWNKSLTVYMGGKPILLPEGASAVFANDYNETGLSLNNQDKFREAIRFYDMALEIKPQYATAWFNKGVASGRIGDFEEAIRCFDRALNIIPTHIDALFTKGTCAYQLKKYAEAVDCYEKVIRLNPHDIEGEQWRAKAEEMLKKSN